MNCRITDLRSKEVICVKDGCRLGNVCDVEIDTCTGQLCAIIVYGRTRWCGLGGRENDICIPWKDIQVIGEETILVCCERPTPEPRKRKRGAFDGLFD
ncbi:MAG TPA: YlmC/YmxH family sporulation protein [Candidatus Fimivicinus intestinavium]|nr:YlmC/YmxH family sporulation protein [Candidatus Fimivicinus intestinavium]